MKSDDPELKQRLLDAALQLFAEHGRDGVSLRDIAEKAGATHGSIRHHFGTKDDLYLTATLQLTSIDLLIKGAPFPHKEPASPEDGERQLIHFVKRFVVIQARTGQNAEASLGMMRAEFMQDGGPDPVFYERVIRPGHENVKRILHAIRPDIDDDETLEILAFNIIFQCVMIRIGNGIVLKRLKKQRLTRRDADRIAGLIADTTLMGLHQLGR